MNCPEVIYRPRPDATPQTELAALCDAYSYLRETARIKEATRPAPEPGGRDGTTVQGDSADAPIVQE